jgi:hypothetical protein
VKTSNYTSVCIFVCETLDSGDWERGREETLWAFALPRRWEVTWNARANIPSSRTHLTGVTCKPKQGTMIACNCRRCDSKVPGRTEYGGEVPRAQYSSGGSTPGEHQSAKRTSPVASRRAPSQSSTWTLLWVLAPAGIGSN